MPPQARRWGATVRDVADREQLLKCADRGNLRVARHLFHWRHCRRQSEHVVEFAIGQQSGIRGHDRAVKLEHQTAVEIEPENRGARFTRRVPRARVLVRQSRRREREWVRCRQSHRATYARRQPCRAGQVFCLKCRRRLASSSSPAIRILDQSGLFLHLYETEGQRDLASHRRQVRLAIVRGDWYSASTSHRMQARVHVRRGVLGNGRRSIEVARFLMTPHGLEHDFQRGSAG